MTTIDNQSFIDHIQQLKPTKIHPQLSEFTRGLSKSYERDFIAEYSKDFKKDYAKEYQNESHPINSIALKHYDTLHLRVQELHATQAEYAQTIKYIETTDKYMQYGFVYLTIAVILLLLIGVTLSRTV